MGRGGDFLMDVCQNCFEGSELRGTQLIFCATHVFAVLPFVHDRKNPALSFEITDFVFLH